jgi:hypothetical protein
MFPRKPAQTGLRTRITGTKRVLVNSQSPVPGTWCRDRGNAPGDLGTESQFS